MDEKETFLSKKTFPRIEHRKLSEIKMDSILLNMIGFH